MRPSHFSLTTPGPVRLYSTKELLKLPPPTWLVEGIMPTGGLAGIYGPPGDGKSFVALDLALCVATGTPWHGHPVEKGYVLYIAAEGGTGIGKRVQAWMQEHHITEITNIAWMIDSIPVNADSSDMDKLLERLNEEVEREPSLVIVDTLARCFDGDENLQEDMGRFIAGVDTFRRQYGATTLIVHHTRLGADRERGSTAFRGAADTMMSVSMDHRTNVITLDCDKQKDDEPFDTIELTLTILEEVNSCVLRQPQKAKAAAREEALFVALGSSKHGMTPKELLKSLVSVVGSRETLFRLLREKVDTGEIVKENGIYRLNRVKGK